MASQSEEEVHQNNEKCCRPSPQFNSRPEISCSKPEQTQKTELIGNSQLKNESNGEKYINIQRIKIKNENSNSSKLEKLESK